MRNLSFTTLFHLMPASTAVLMCSVWFLVLAPSASAIGTITLITPNGGERYAPGDTVTIRWQNPGLNVVSFSYERCYDDARENCSPAGNIVFGYATNPASAEGAYTWTIPADAVPNDRYVLQLFNGQSPNTSEFFSGDSVGFFEISSPSHPVPKLIHITSSAPGALLEAGKSYTFTWELQGVPEVSLVLWPTGGSSSIAYTIVNSLSQEVTASTGAYTTTIPKDIIGGAYELRLSGFAYQHALDPLAVPVTVVSDKKTLDRLPEYRAKVSFIAGATIGAGSRFPIQWESQCTGGDVNIWLVRQLQDGEQLFPLVPYKFPASFLYDNANYNFPKWNIPNSVYTPNTGSYTVQIPSQLYLSEFYFDHSPGVTFHIFRDLSGGFIVREYLKPVFTPLVPGTYTLRVDIVNASSCRAAGVSEPFPIGASSVPTPTPAPPTPTPPTSQEKAPPAAAVSDVVAREKALTTRANAALQKRLQGKILLQVEGNGEAWYVGDDGMRFYLSDGPRAYTALRTFGLGISNHDVAGIPIGIETRAADVDTDADGLSDKLEEAISTDSARADSDGDGVSDGEEVRAGYDPADARPAKRVVRGDLVKRLEGKILLQVESRGEAWYVHDGKRFYMKDGNQAYQIMRYLSLGITNTDLHQIPVGDLE